MDEHLINLQNKYNALAATAKAVVDRWDTPLWKDIGPTADVINALRTTLEEPEVEFRCPKCGAQVDENWDCCEVYEEEAFVQWYKETEKLAGYSSRFWDAKKINRLKTQWKRGLSPADGLIASS